MSNEMRKKVGEKGGKLKKRNYDDIYEIYKRKNYVSI